MFAPRSAVASLIVCLTLASAGNACAWAPKKGQLMTRWSADVNPAHPLPEYPRPQMVRRDWLCLNGVWEYQPGKENDAVPAGKKLASEILVPFPVESALSGVMEHHERLWYRRTFTVPTEWSGRQVVVRFGAVDYESEVFLNGKRVGLHRGGYDPFSFDLTPFLSPTGGPQEIVVRVYDPTDAGGQPRGKQTTRPDGIMYTSVTGIWQTVWLEPVARGGVGDLKLVPDVDGGRLRLTVDTVGDAPAESVSVTVRAGATVVGTATGAAGKEISVPVPEAKLWSPDQPFLYDLQVSVSSEGRVIDQVGSYFGMRKIEVADVDGVKKMLLNGKFTFQSGPLDQGFWPDGIYTAPTEAALKYDLQAMKDLGFNMVRKHLKVEPARWYYWADRLGLLVWQDMPSATTYLSDAEREKIPLDKAAFDTELMAMVHHLRNAPSIIVWDLFNEYQSQHDTPRLVALVKDFDPTRLVNEASGGGYFNSGDIYDLHNYPPPACPPPNKTEALVCGEYGGIGLKVPGHLWVDRGRGYTDVTSPADMENLYADYTDEVRQLRDKRGMSAAVYTQFTDVETEINGFLTYDRQPKVETARIARINHFQRPPATYTAIVPTSETTAQDWKYTTQQPATNWMKKDFDDSTWAVGKGGFGTSGTPGIGILGTPWKTDGIWLRRTFNPGALTAEQIAGIMVRDYHDEDIEVYLNGVLACRQEGFYNYYENRPISAEARKALVPNASNVMAVSCKQTTGGQYVDVGLSIHHRDRD